MIDEGRTQSSTQQPAAQSDALQIDPVDAVWLLSSFAALHHQSCDLESLARECVPPMALSHLQALGDRLGLKVSISTEIARGFDDVPLAVQVSTASSERLEWAIVLAADTTSALVSFRSTGAPTTLAIAEFSPRPTGVTLRVKPEVAAARDPDIAAASTKPFGFRWFVPELLKHKHIWREVLLASLVLQLIALALPLFTQAIIDKVVVHRTQSTLITLAIGRDGWCRKPT